MDTAPVFANFPAWLRLCHWVNVLFITLLIRSGMQILFDLPKLYWHDDCTPGTEWLKLGKKQLPKEGLWTSHDEAEWISPVIAMPGGFHTVGPARAWHFLSVLFWVLNGAVYAALLLGTGEWHRLIPTSWDVIPRAFNDLLTYISFHVPPRSEFHPYDSLQQLAYAGVVFILAPLAIITGALQSPALHANFPELMKMAGGRQALRSSHFLVLVAYVIFIVIHIALVVITDFVGNMNNIVFGTDSGSLSGIWCGLGIIALILLVHVVATLTTQKHPRAVQRSVGAAAEAVLSLLLHNMRSHQQYTQKDLSPYVRVNGRPPTGKEWLSLKQNHFEEYTLKIFGLVENPVDVTLDELRALSRSTQITKHHCVQGWTAIAEWSGVRLSEIVKLVKPLPTAKYLLFRTYQNGPDGSEFYGTIPIEDAFQDQTLLAFDMNGGALPDEYGAPLRLRVETYVGFKMTKWIKSIEFIEDYSKVFGGQGGYREDREFQFNLPRA